MHPNPRKKFMNSKKCCYLQRDCTPDCVAYCDVNELAEGATKIGMNELHCIRLFLEIAEKMEMISCNEFEDFEEYSPGLK